MGTMMYDVSFFDSLTRLAAVRLRKAFRVSAARGGA